MKPVKPIGRPRRTKYLSDKYEIKDAVASTASFNYVNKRLYKYYFLKIIKNYRFLLLFMI